MFCCCPVRMLDICLKFHSGMSGVGGGGGGIGYGQLVSPTSHEKLLK